MEETTTPSEHGMTVIGPREIKNLHPTSRLGQFFFPSGKAGEFGQVAQVEIIYTDGQTKRYYVEED